MRDLVSTFRQVANTQGDATALIAGAAHISFADLAARAGGFAQHLHARGIRPGARVLVAMPVGIDLFVALAGAWAAGLSVVFPEPAMGLRGLRHAVSTTKPEAFLASGSYTWIKPIVPGLWRCKTLAPRGTMAPLPDAPDPSSTALISFTSGSTGRPKAIARSHAFLMAQHSAVAPLLAGAGVDLVAFPVFTLVNLAAGRTSVLPGWRLSRPEQVTPADLTRCIGASGATRALLPPSLCETLVESGDLGPLHTVFTGGGPVKPQLVAALRDRGLRVVSVYGSTEAEPIAELDWADATDTDIALMQNGGGLLAGHPVPGLSLRLKDDEIQVAGAHVNEGYLDPADDRTTKLRDPESGATWHRTGDAGRLDDQGRLWLLGRSAAVRAEGDQKLYPFAVELAAEAWPGVRQAALADHAGRAVLVIAGDLAALPDWRGRAKGMGIDTVRHVQSIPMDRRHRSKVDYAALLAMLK